MNLIDSAIAHTEANLPDDITVSQALLMPWGGARNIALRKAIGATDDEIALIDHHHNIQVVTRHTLRAGHLTTQLERQLPDGWTTMRHQRTDGAWVIAAIHTGA